MRCALVVFSLLVLAVSVLGEESRPEVVKSRPVGVIYLIKLLNQPPDTKNDLEITNSIPTDYPNEKENNKFLLALAPSSGPKEIREKRSPTKKGYGYGGGGHKYGGGGCNVCGGSGGGYYPSGGGGSFSQSHASASASSGSFSGGYYG